MLGTFATGMFLHNTQLNRSYVGWDIVQEAGFIAADTANKVLCASPAAGLGETRGARADAVFEAIRSRLELVTDNPRERCSLSFSAAKVQPGSPLDVKLDCELDCPIPIAGRLICPDGKLHVSTQHTIQPGGCDRK